MSDTTNTPAENTVSNIMLDERGFLAYTPEALAELRHDATCMDDAELADAIHFSETAAGYDPLRDDYLAVLYDEQARRKRIAEAVAEQTARDAEMGEATFTVTLHYDEHPTLGERVAWTGRGRNVAVAHARDVVKALLVGSAHGYIEHTAPAEDGSETHSVYRRDWRPGSAGYILVAHADVARVRAETE